MNLKGLSKAVADQVGAPASGVRAVLEKAFELIGDQVAAGEAVRIKGFGKVTSKIRKGRKGRNPRSGEAIVLQPMVVVRFVAGSALKAKIRANKVKQ